jgi:hypothetical protein
MARKPKLAQTDRFEDGQEATDALAITGALCRTLERVRFTVTNEGKSVRVDVVRSVARSVLAIVQPNRKDVLTSLILSVETAETLSFDLDKALDLAVRFDGTRTNRA